MTNNAIIIWIVTFASLVSLTAALPVTDLPLVLKSPNLYNLTEPEDVQTQRSGILVIDPRFSLTARFAPANPIPPLSIYMAGVEALGQMAPRPFTGTQPAQNFVIPGYEDVVIYVTGSEDGSQIPLPRKYAVWGIQQGLYQIGLRGLRNIYTLSSFTLKYDGIPVGTVVFAATTPSSPEQSVLVSRADLVNTRDSSVVSDPSIPAFQAPDEQDTQATEFLNAWEGHLEPTFGVTAITMPAYFNACGFGLAWAAEQNSNNRVETLSAPVDTLQFHLEVRDYTSVPRTRPPFFTYGWAVYGLVEAAREGAQRVRPGERLTQMEGVVGLGRPGRTIVTKVGRIRLISLSQK